MLGASFHPAAADAPSVGDRSAGAHWEEWAGSPEVHQNLGQIHYLVPLTFDGQRKAFCFPFLIAEDQLCRESGHLSQQIGWEEYRQLYEVVWCDRVAHAGWELDIAYLDDDTSVLDLRR